MSLLDHCKELLLWTGIISCICPTSLSYQSYNISMNCAALLDCSFNEYKQNHCGTILMNKINMLIFLLSSCAH